MSNAAWTSSPGMALPGRRATEARCDGEPLMTDHDDIVNLTSAANEIEAAAIVAHLEANGIQARQVGGLTSGFRAECPGYVQILVRQNDLERARALLENLQDG